MIVGPLDAALDEVSDHPLGGGMSQRRAGGQISGKLTYRRVESVLGPDPVDNIPALHLGRAVPRAGHDKFPGATGARSLGQPLSPAQGRSETDHPLHQSEAG